MFFRSNSSDIRLLQPLRLRRESHSGDISFDGSLLLHEHGLEHGAFVLADAFDRNLLLVHHDHGGQLHGKLLELSQRQVGLLIGGVPQAATILILNFHHKQTSNTAMPGVIRSVFLVWLPWFLRMSRPGQKITIKSIRLEKTMKKLDKTDAYSKSLMFNVLDLDDNALFGKKPPPYETYNEDRVTRGLKSIRDEMKIITDKLKGEEEAHSVENEWRFAAMVLDRVCLILSSVLFFIMSAAVLISAPHIFVG